MQVSILGSRDQLCIHPEVSKEQNNAAKLHMCHARTTTRTCYYYTNLDAKKEEPDFKESVLDIEDLVKLGKKHSACPYFMAREIRKRADIIFMPYNYLLDPKVRKIHNIELRVSDKSSAIAIITCVFIICRFFAGFCVRTRATW